MPSALFVILIFVAIVVVGSGKKLLAFSSRVAQFRPISESRLRGSWSLIPLLTNLNMFWNCTETANRGDRLCASFILLESAKIGFAGN